MLQRILLSGSLAARISATASIATRTWTDIYALLVCVHESKQSESYYSDKRFVT